MILKGIVSILGILFVAAAWTGCATNDAKPVAVVCTADEIRKGDTLSINLLDVPTEYAGEKQFVVRDDGAVNLPSLGSIKAAGKKFADFERDVQTNYIGKGIFRQVTVVVKPGDRFYTIAGEVKSPGRLIYSGETTLLRAIASCGDFTDFANRTKVEITRYNGDRETVDCKKAAKDPRKFDRAICPGDYISVPRSL